MTDVTLIKPLNDFPETPYQTGAYTYHADLAHAYRSEIVQDILEFCRLRNLL